MRYSLLVALLLSNCATTRTEYTPASAGDSLLAQAGLPAKVKARTVIIQLAAPGSTQTVAMADNRKAGQRQGSAATAPGAVASTTTKQAGTPWWLFAIVGALSIVIWEWLTRRLAWLPWRVRPG